MKIVAHLYAVKGYGDYNQAVIRNLANNRIPYRQRGRRNGTKVISVEDQLAPKAQEIVNKIPRKANFNLI